MPNQIFSIPEILELILLHLDPRTLLSVQQTCHLWNHTIKHSSALQKALFFTPDNTAEKIRNPLLEDAFPALFESPRQDEDQDNTNGSALSTFDMIQKRTLHAYLRPEASWRRMLVQQPPVSKIGVFRMGYGMARVYIYDEIGGFPDGLRMGDFFESVLFQDDRFVSCECKRVVWWGMVTGRDRKAWEEMEKLRGETVDADIVVTLRSYSSCVDPWPVVRTEDEIAFDEIRAVYEEMGIEPKEYGRTEVWRDLHMC